MSKGDHHLTSPHHFQLSQNPHTGAGCQWLPFHSRVSYDRTIFSFLDRPLAVCFVDSTLSHHDFSTEHESSEAISRPFGDSARKYITNCFERTAPFLRSSLLLLS
jgi:hypothetical protein